MYENIPTNLIIWMAKRNIADSAFAAQVGLTRPNLLKIKKGKSQDIQITEALVNKFARALDVSKEILLAEPAVVEIAYFPEVLNEYIVHRRPAPALAKELGISAGLIEQVRLKHIDRVKPETVQSKKEQINTLLTEEQIALFEKEMGICFTRNHTSPSLANSSSNSEMHTRDDGSRTNGRQKRLSPGSSGLGFIGNNDPNKRLQVRGPGEARFPAALSDDELGDIPPPLGILIPQPAPHPHEVPLPQLAPYPHDVSSPQPVLRSHDIPSPQLALHPYETPPPQQSLNSHEVTDDQPAADSMLVQQLHKKIAELKQELREVRAHQASPLPAPNEPGVLTLCAELDAVKRQINQLTMLSSSAPVDGMALLQTMIAFLNHQQLQSGFYQVPPSQELLSQRITALNMQLGSLEQRLLQLNHPSEYNSPFPQPSPRNTEHQYGHPDYPPTPVPLSPAQLTPLWQSPHRSRPSISGYFSQSPYPMGGLDRRSAYVTIPSPIRPDGSSPSSIFSPLPSPTANPGMSTFFPTSSPAGSRHDLSLSPSSSSTQTSQVFDPRSHNHL